MKTETVVREIISSSQQTLFGQPSLDWKTNQLKRNQGHGDVCGQGDEDRRWDEDRGLDRG